MDNYECKLCNYITKKQGNYNRHIKTNKHTEKVMNSTELKINKTIKKMYNSDISPNHPKTPPNHPKEPKKVALIRKIICEYCHTLFTRISSLTKHKNICASKHSTEKRLEEQIKLLNMELKHYKDKSESKEEETNYYKKLLQEAGGLVKKSVSALSYVVTNYDNAPAIKTIKLDGLAESKEEEKKLVEDIISAYKHKTLSKYLGDIIIKIYKKDNPKDQSIWNTDDSRLTYLIKELIGNETIGSNSSNWVVDKKGVKTQTYIVEPLLSHIKDLLIYYQTNLVIPDLRQNSTEIEFILENNKKILDLVNDIDDGAVAKDTLKYISSHLRINGKLIE